MFDYASFNRPAPELRHADSRRSLPGTGVSKRLEGIVHHSFATKGLLKEAAAAHEALEMGLFTHSKVAEVSLEISTLTTTPTLQRS